MVMLYKDPNGERVFSDNEGEIRQVTILEGTPLGENKVDGLKKRIKHLENMINEHKVCQSCSYQLCSLYDCVCGYMKYLALNVFSHACTIV